MKELTSQELDAVSGGRGNFLKLANLVMNYGSGGAEGALNSLLAYAKTGFAKTGSLGENQQLAYAGAMLLKNAGFRVPG